MSLPKFVLFSLVLVSLIFIVVVCITCSSHFGSQCSSLLFLEPPLFFLRVNPPSFFFFGLIDGVQG